MIKLIVFFLKGLEKTENDAKFLEIAFFPFSRKLFN